MLLTGPHYNGGEVIISGPFITLQHLFIGFPSLLCLILLPGLVNKYYLIMDYPIRYFIRPTIEFFFFILGPPVLSYHNYCDFRRTIHWFTGTGWAGLGPWSLDLQWIISSWALSITLPIILLQGREQQGNRWEADLTGSVNYFHPRIFIIRCSIQFKYTMCSVRELCAC